MKYFIWNFLSRKISTVCVSSGQDCIFKLNYHYKILVKFLGQMTIWLTS